MSKFLNNDAETMLKILSHINIVKQISSNLNLKEYLNSFTTIDVTCSI